MTPEQAAIKPATEVWQRGPVAGFPAELQPVVHALLQVSEETEQHALTLSHDQLWLRPFSVASIGFHLLHIAGSTDRLLSYARGEALAPGQVQYARAEGTPLPPDITAAVMVAGAQAALRTAIEQVRGTALESLYAIRYVGKARIESTVSGLLFHAAEHASRHAGQLATTAKIVRAISNGQHATTPTDTNA